MIHAPHTRFTRPGKALARPLLVCALACAVAASALAMRPAPAFASTGVRPPVVVILAPFLTFSDLSPTRTPQLWHAVETGAIGALNAHTGDPGWPTVAGGALTISASRWAIGPVGGPYDAASLARARSINASSLALPDFGALGSAIHAGGGQTFAIGASDTDTMTPEGRRRYAEYVATDASGSVDSAAGDVLVADGSAPYGLRTDPARVRDALANVHAQVSRALIVMDPGDLERAHDQTATYTAYIAAHKRAVATLDQELQDAISLVAGDQGLVLVVPAATDKDWYKQPDFGPLIAVGAGWHGTIISESTRRDGLAANLDIAPTVLAAFGLDTPATMLGKPLSFADDGSSAAARIAALSRSNQSVGAIDQLRDAWFLPWFAWLAMGAVALAALVAGRATSERLRGVAMFSELALTLVLSAFPAGWLMFVIDPNPTSVPEAFHAFAVTLLAVAGATFAVRALYPKVRVAGPLFLASLTTLMVLVDQWFGNPIQSGLFSYSSAAGWRFYGMGNEGAAIAVGASIAAVALLADSLTERSGLHWLVRRAGIPFVGIIVLVTAAAPFAGANAGVAVWGVIAYAVAWAAMNGVKLSWRNAGLTLIAVIVAVSAFAAIDLMRAGGGTHLARFASGILGGDVRGTWDLVWRKLQNNINYLPQTPYTGLAIVLALSLLGAQFAKPHPLRRVRDFAPMYAVAVIGVLAGGLAAWATEDSGIVMPALMLAAGAAPLLILALRTPPAEDSAEA